MESNEGLLGSDGLCCAWLRTSKGPIRSQCVRGHNLASIEKLRTQDVQGIDAIVDGHPGYKMSESAYPLLTAKKSRIEDGSVFWEYKQALDDRN
jgi:hypothetical protein